ncbi:MAG TPA: SPFH domain-containing protein, partial [Actinomycetes bacterium]|nr:SPFH domain-containing protein [Actinomycetes bacterium]
MVGMSAQAPVSPGQQLAARQVPESEAWSAPGVRVLVLGVATLLAGIALLILAARQGGGAAQTMLLVAAILLLITAGLARYGLTSVVAGEARAVQLFGRYRGTIRAPGLHWVNPFARRRRVSTRIRNHETAVAKVNDADGNPIEIAAVVVWQVQDTAKAINAVDNFPEFVAIQTETAVRHIASS